MSGPGRCEKYLGIFMIPGKFVQVWGGGGRGGNSGVGENSLMPEFSETSSKTRVLGRNPRRRHAPGKFPPGGGKI